MNLVRIGVLALVVVGCAERSGERPAAGADAPVRTDTTAYLLERYGPGWRTTLRLSYRNPTTDTLHIINCNGAYTLTLERDRGGGWQRFWTSLTDGCLSPPLTIPPGDSLVAEWVLLGAAPGGNAGPAFADTSFEGRFRLRWENVVRHYDPRPGGFGDTLPVAQRISNLFTLRIRRRSRGPRRRRAGCGWTRRVG